MGPFVTQVKKASKDVWMQLPPPVRQVAPYVGASVGTGLLVYRIQPNRLNNAVSINSNRRSCMSVATVAYLVDLLQNAKNDKLQQRIELLVTERDDAKILAKELKVLHVPAKGSNVLLHLHESSYALQCT